MSIPLDPDFEKTEAKQAGQWERPPAGPYVMKVVSVEEKTSRNNNPMLVIELDIAEGLHAGAFAEFPAKFYQLTSGNSLAYFKGMLSAFRESNQSVNWKAALEGGRFDSQVLTGRIIGASLREEEYINKDNQFRTALKPAFLCSVKKVHDGEVATLPLIKLEPKGNQGGYAPGNGAPLHTDDDLPF